MGGLAGVFTQRSDNATGLVEDMLKSLRHRGNQSRVIALEASERHVAGIGYCAHHDLDGHFAKSSRTTLAIDGSFFERNQTRQANYALRKLVSTANSRASIAGIMNETGVFSVLYGDGKRLYAFRDAAGFKPLYCGRDRRTVAFASERKALWKIGLKDIKRIPPSQLLTTSSKGISKSNLAHFSRSASDKALTMKKASSRLERLLRKSIQRIAKKQDRLAVAFSGGLDSSLTAVLAKQTCASVELVTVGLSGSVELASAEAYAKQIDIPITLEAFSPDSLEEYVRRIIWLIEESNLMKVSIAIPLHWAAEAAARRGHKIMLCGQGSDELYGGYYKYAKTLDSRGRRALESELYHSVIESHIVNYERDDQATAPTGVELRTPFTDPDLVQYSLMIPSEFKVKRGNDVMRKWILRTVGQKLGLPQEIAWRRKKAIQHGTGVEHAILKLAKQEGLSPDVYLKRIHVEVLTTESMP